MRPALAESPALKRAPTSAKPRSSSPQHARAGTPGTRWLRRASRCTPESAHRTRIRGARTGQRPAGGDHGQAVSLLNRAGREGTDAARILTRLMPLKNRAEYEPDDVPKATARRAVEQADRIVGIARQVVT